MSAGLRYPGLREGGVAAWPRGRVAAWGQRAQAPVGGAGPT